VSLAPAGGLSVRTAAERLHLEGDAGDPPVARVGDLVCRIAIFPGAPPATPAAAWISTSAEAPYTWSPVATCLVTGPLSSDGGTEIRVTTGSDVVTCR
jgi:hypothetical protein